MNREFVYYDARTNQRHERWTVVAATFSRWIWGVVCCGVPGVPCYFCQCCTKTDEEEVEIPRGLRTYINSEQYPESTATAQHVSRQHRPHALRGRKCTPEMLSAVRCALSQLQGDTAPPLERNLKKEPE